MPTTLPVFVSGGCGAEDEEIRNVSDDDAKEGTTFYGEKAVSPRPLASAQG